LGRRFDFIADGLIFAVNTCPFRTWTFFEVTLDGLAFNSEAATLAFLVVLRVLIKLFFSIAMVFTRSLLKFLSRRRCPIVQVVCQSGWISFTFCFDLKTKEL